MGGGFLISLSHEAPCPLHEQQRPGKLGGGGRWGWGDFPAETKGLQVIVEYSTEEQDYVDLWKWRS